jgi:structural maintenance of chromosome 3 (chondroitin sulfate proteoglycan 6)
MEQQRTTQVALVQTEQEQMAHLRRTLTELQTERQTTVTALTKHTQEASQLQTTIDEQSRQRLEYQESRKQIWRQREQLADQIRQGRDTVRRCKEEVRKTIPRATSLGLDALSTIVEQEGFQHGVHYFGPVVQNFRLQNEKFQTAVEVAGQNALFHVIVDTDETASRLVQRLEEEKLGRVTFLPLAQLRIPQPKTPEDPLYRLPKEHADVRPFLETCLKYDVRVEKALQHVFGKKVLCKDLDTATEWSSKLGVDGITLDGDVCSRKGSMTGGYVDVTKSRLRAYKALETAQSELQTLQEQMVSVEDSAKKTDQQLSVVQQELQRLGTQQAQLTHVITQKKATIDRIDQRQVQSQKALETLEKTTLPPLQRNLATLDKEMERLREEIGTELVETLSESDRQVLHDFKDTQGKLESSIQEQSEKVAQLGLERQKLQSLLQDNLYKRRRELSDGTSTAATTGTRRSSSRRGGNEDDDDEDTGRSSSSAATVAQKKEELEELERDLDEAKRQKTQVQAAYDKARANDEKLQDEEAKARTELENLRNEDMKYSKKFEEAQERSERLLNKVRVYGGVVDEFVVVVFLGVLANLLTDSFVIKPTSCLVLTAWNVHFET